MKMPNSSTPDSMINSPKNRKVKFAESIVTYAADSSNATSPLPSNSPSVENSFSIKKTSHNALYNDESIFKNLEIF